MAGFESELLARHEENGISWEHIAPATPSAVASLLSQARQTGKQVIVGTPVLLPQALPGKEIVFIDLAGLNKLVEHRPLDQMVSVEAGMTIGTLHDILSESKQWLPVYADRSSSVSDLVSTSAGGCLEHGFGGPRDLVLGLTAAVPAGHLITLGGSVVKNVSGYDLQKLFIGSRNCLGVVCQANLRLFARPQAKRSLLAAAHTPQRALAMAGKLIRSGLPISCLELVGSHLLGSLLCPGAGSPVLPPALAVAPHMVLIEVHGSHVLVEKTSAEVKKHLCHLSEGICALDHEQAERLWLTLSEQRCLDLPFALELACCPSQMLSLMSTWWTDVGSPAWQARPGKGKIKFLSPDMSCLTDMVDSFKSWADKRQENMTLAYGGRQLTVEHLGNNGKRVAALTAAIKSCFAW